MSGGLSGGLPTSVEELRALVMELVAANAGLQEVIAAKDHQIAAQERRIAELESTPYRASFSPYSSMHGTDSTIAP